MLEGCNFEAIQVKRRTTFKIITLIKGSIKKQDDKRLKIWKNVQDSPKNLSHL